MTSKPKPNKTHGLIYQIEIEEHLFPDWSDWFAGLTISLEADGHTLLTGPILDQAAIYGFRFSFDLA